jgi:type I restriction enzyme M protein
VLYVPDEAKLSHLVALPEGENLGKAIDDAMKTIETANSELRDVLPRGYQRIAKSTLTGCRETPTRATAFGSCLR